MQLSPYAKLSYLEPLTGLYEVHETQEKTGEMKELLHILPTNMPGLLKRLWQNSTQVKKNQ